MSGLMSGDGKRAAPVASALPRPSSTLPNYVTEAVRIETKHFYQKMFEP